MAAGGAYFLVVVVFSMLIMSSLGNHIPLCSDCETLCRTNCTAEAETYCSNYCKDCQGCTRGYFDEYCYPKCVNNCNNSCEKEGSSLVHPSPPPRPFCSDCEPQCRTNCNALVESRCRATCNDKLSSHEDCWRAVFQGCTADGSCCSSNDTCTCDCNTVAQDRCIGVSDNDNYTDCEACKRDQFDQCYSTCKNDCNNSCKKKGCRHA
ncbi:unnamed protein product [Triticum turgidum subsp. durum]|uniref:Uncharacterized protein n=1 Tax=Triticum turgidum subsp. durum TaxID=4567 RepID=A0A9R0Q132_TRITD|nr:unnamed protein product [Triticum turgidum subsp. durum]VAH70635.1 unnamed protein product [Triticum turgidum subsp. durum]